MPGAGSVFTTTPELYLALGVGTTITLSPSCVKVLEASVNCWPITLGTVMGAGPELNVSVMALPFGTLVPAVSDCAMT